ncbi:ergothioneine biosynthesis protein EgtC [Streptomyces nitrosporeus]|uniref:Gamma-glutamyl-hercynylcysteine sulfoxide hydrolase n=1 Tax=Streptomyces nitrosporeus TaxID=28894 RepID=A0A5J6F3P9_9ACTN|nr:ergothioneine biosynthesis protein EgtC [Streptomyces nitrosporeus]QEU70657.1 ergothioneine biosynthesis protein EgtC [Streptomyces nitrosporeus]GGZ06061.1 gamma-glutamyl-hercynylcysteine sulfoxide hydrolase [Streptomyces nitrosporeus]
MCRHIAYVGPSVPLGEILTAPERSLVRQSWDPRHQRSGTVNADGFGVGWYAEGDPVPGRYRRRGPVWGDETFTDLARVVRSPALLGAVRDATRAGADGEAAAAPFTGGRLLFSHNGAVRGWPGSLAAAAGALPPERLLTLAARSDSALVWALVQHRIAEGGDIPRAVAGTVLDIAGAAPGSRLNLLLTDGAVIVATAWGDSLWYLHEPGHRAVVASEPYDGAPHWREVPDRTLLTASRTGVSLSPIEEPFA